MTCCFASTLQYSPCHICHNHCLYTHYASLIQELKNSILPPKLEGAELATKQLCVKLSDENEVMSSVFAVVAAHLAALHHYSLRFFHLKCWKRCASQKNWSQDTWSAVPATRNECQSLDIRTWKMESPSGNERADRQLNMSLSKLRRAAPAPQKCTFGENLQMPCACQHLQTSPQC